MDKSEAMHHEACIPESWWELPMPSMYTIIHHFTITIGEPLLRSCMDLSQT